MTLTHRLLSLRPSGLVLVTALALIPAVAHAQTVTIYFGAKRQHYTQRTDTGAELAGYVKSRFANAVYLSDGTISSPTLTMPNGDFAGTTSFFQLGTSNDWIRNYDFIAVDGVDAFQPGDYVYNIGGTSVALTLADDVYPTAPSITGATWADNKLVANNSSTYSLTFDGPTAGSFTDGTDYLRLTLRPQSDGTTYVYDSFTFTSGFDIPAYSLMDGMTYDLELQVFNVTEIDTTSIAGATGLIGYSIETFAELLVDNSASPSAVPEPASAAALIGLVTAGMVGTRRRRS